MSVSEPAPGQPWAFIAHKEGRFAGVCAANVPKRDLREYLGDFAARGCTITTVHNRDEYNEWLKKLKMWGAE